MSEPHEKKMRVVCMDCGYVIQVGDPGAKTSHGLCDRCFPIRIEEVSRMPKKEGAA